MCEERLIEFDLECDQCGYNLRALPAGHRCPECGQPAPPGVTTRRDLLVYRQIKECRPLAQRVGCSVNALLFVRDAISFAQAQRPAHQFFRQLSARDVCAGICAYARNYFNDDAEARELLGEWGIRRSEDVGAIVSGLVRERQLIPAAEDRIDDFQGVFTLETLFDPVA